MSSKEYLLLENQYNSVVEQNRNLQERLNIYQLTLTAIKETADLIYDDSDYENFINGNIFLIKKLTDEALSCDLKHFENLLKIIDKPKVALKRINEIAHNHLKYGLSGCHFEPTKETKVLEEIIKECEAEIG